MFITDAQEETRKAWEPEKLGNKNWRLLGRRGASTWAV